jgi:NADH-quinone oxidoreductase subunit C
MTAVAASEVLGSRVAGLFVREEAIVVPRAAWVAAAVAARELLAARCFDFLTAVDAAAEGFLVVTGLVAPGGPRLLLETAVPVDDAWVDTLTGVFRGAAWHERETAEMFGIDFRGHPDPRPLLLSDDGARAHPLRKDVALAERVETVWPGSVEPTGAATRRPQVPYGVPPSP